MTAVIFTLVMTHITASFFSLYVHRSMSHRQVTFHPALAHVMRFWLWLTDGSGIKEWVAIHQLHHCYTDQQEDPHWVFVNGGTVQRLCAAAHGFYTQVVYGYRNFIPREDVELFGHNTPNDWIERNLYAPYQRMGLWIMLAIDLALFDWWGIAVWLVQISWVTLWFTVIVTSFGHWVGYSDPKSRNSSKNLFPIGILMAGEELHSNHHTYPAQANLRRRWYEFDLGYHYIQLFRILGLAKVNT